MKVICVTTNFSSKTVEIRRQCSAIFKVLIDFSRSVWWKMILNLVLICISFDMNEVKHFFICLRVSGISFLFILSFYSLGFLISSLRALLFVVELQIYFPQFASCLLTLLMVVFYHPSNFYDQVVKFVYLFFCGFWIIKSFPAASFYKDSCQCFLLYGFSFYTEILSPLGVFPYIWCEIWV